MQRIAYAKAKSSSIVSKELAAAATGSRTKRSREELGGKGSESAKAGRIGDHSSASLALLTV